MTPTVLGIDISKKTFHAALMLENGKSKPKVFSNDPEGFNDLLSVAFTTSCHPHSCLHGSDQHLW